MKRTLFILGHKIKVTKIEFRYCEYVVPAAGTLCPKHHLPALPFREDIGIHKIEFPIRHVLIFGKLKNSQSLLPHSCRGAGCGV